MIPDLNELLFDVQEEDEKTENDNLWNFCDENDFELDSKKAPTMVQPMIDSLAQFRSGESSSILTRRIPVEMLLDFQQSMGSGDLGWSTSQDLVWLNVDDSYRFLKSAILDLSIKQLDCVYLILTLEGFRSVQFKCPDMSSAQAILDVIPKVKQPTTLVEPVQVTSQESNQIDGIRELEMKRDELIIKRDAELERIMVKYQLEIDSLEREMVQLKLTEQVCDLCCDLSSDLILFPCKHPICSTCFDRLSSPKYCPWDRVLVTKTIPLNKQS